MIISGWSLEHAGDFQRGGKRARGPPSSNNNNNNSFRSPPGSQVSIFVCVLQLEIFHDVRSATLQHLPAAGSSYRVILKVAVWHSCFISWRRVAFGHPSKRTDCACTHHFQGKSSKPLGGRRTTQKYKGVNERHRDHAIEMMTLGERKLGLDFLTPFLCYFGSILPCFREACISHSHANLSTINTGHNQVQVR